MTQRTNTFTIFFLIALMLMFIEGFLFGNGSIVFAVAGLFGIIFAMKKKTRVIFWISAGMIVLVLVSMWSMRLIVLAILGYIVLKMMRKEPVEFDFSSYKSAQKKYVNPLITFDSMNASEAYEWRDVHIQNAAGDIMIDTTSTILPKDTSLITVRQGFGKTTVYVPYEVPVRIHFNTLFGEIHAFDNQYNRLFNESITLQDGVTIETPQQLIITVSTFLGDLEVIRK